MVDGVGELPDAVSSFARWRTPCGASNRGLYRRRAEVHQGTSSAVIAGSWPSSRRSSTWSGSPAVPPCCSSLRPVAVHDGDRLAARRYRSGTLSVGVCEPRQVDSRRHLLVAGHAW